MMSDYDDEISLRAEIEDLEHCLLRNNYWQLRANLLLAKAKLQRFLSEKEDDAYDAMILGDHDYLYDAWKDGER